MFKIARKYHSKLTLLVGLQLLIWSITGLYMVSMDIHFIHGESLTKSEQRMLDIKQVNYSINELLTNYPTAKNVTLVPLLDNQVYRFSDSKNGKMVIDADTGQVLPSVDQQKAIQIAKSHYVANDEIDSIRLITATKSVDNQNPDNDIPSELSKRHLPVWQVSFNNFMSPTLYISQLTGEVVTKRHLFWRLFDWMWRFHIMDYDDGSNVSNWFLLLITIVSLGAALTGCVLTYQSLVKPKLKRLF